MKRSLLVLAICLQTAVSVAVLAPILSALAAPPAAALSAFVEMGRDARIASYSMPEALASSSSRPSFVIVDAASLSTLEAEALERQAAAGTDVWIIGTTTSHVVPAAQGFDILPGAITSEAGGAPDVLEDGHPLDRQLGLRAIVINDAAWAPALRVEKAAFRDTNGDGKIESGEPAGPFTVAIERAEGAGHLTWLAVDGGIAATSPALIADWSVRETPGSVWIEAPSTSPVQRVASVLDRIASLPSLDVRIGFALVAVAGAGTGLAMLPPDDPPSHRKGSIPQAWARRHRRNDEENA